MRKSTYFLMLVVALFCCTFNTYAQEPIVVLNENFDAFTEGSIDQPGKTDITTYSSGKLTSVLKGWSGSKVYEAGGCLLIEQYGSLKTTSLSLSTIDGRAKITFRAKAKAEYGGIIDLTLGYTKISTFYTYDNEWHTYTFVSDKGTSSSAIKISPALEGIYIDDLKVEKDPSFVVVPVPSQPSNATDTSFTASWKSVSGVSKYLLNVYSYDSNKERVYFMQDEVVSTTSKVVSGLTKGVKYYFTVRAVNGDYSSDESAEIKVIKKIDSLATPVVKSATNISDSEFTANWDLVEDATAYTVSLLKHETFNKATNAVILSDDFSKITVGTIDAVEYGSLEGSLNAYTKTPGWTGDYYALAAGYLAMSPYSTSKAVITTPVLDIDGGATLKLNMAECKYGVFTQGATVTVKLAKQGDNGEVVLESQDITINNEGFIDYTLDFVKLEEGCYIKLEYADSSNKLFINNFVLSKDFKAGETLVSYIDEITLDSEDEENPATVLNEYTFEAPKADNIIYGYVVSASAITVDYSGNYVSVMSKGSEEMLVQDSTDAEVADCDMTKVYSDNGQVVVVLPSDVEVNVYDMYGRLAASKQCVAGENTINSNANFVIVKINNKAYKVKL